MFEISERTKNLGTENAFVVLKEVNNLVSQGRDIINFCIGQPDFDTPEHIKQAAIKAIIPKTKTKLFSILNLDHLLPLLL